MGRSISRQNRSKRRKGKNRGLNLNSGFRGGTKKIPTFPVTTKKITDPNDAPASQARAPDNEKGKSKHGS